MKRSHEQVARRSFLTRFGLGTGVLGGMLGAVWSAKAAVAGGTWQPARHAKDDWFDEIPGQHRLVFDTTSADGIAGALQYAGNFYTANQNEYGLGESDIAVVVVARHKSTSFGYNDAMWAKYGKHFSEHANFTDPKTKDIPVVNVYATAGGRMDGLLKKGLRLWVCQMATRNISGIIARAIGADTDAVFKELGQNLVPNARLVPAGIVAVSRAQERGYSFVYGTGL